ncbi:chromosome segregation protein SMC [Pediococcus claussenii]|uniref:chromosome segregation protein SMC n=1 Tax=Pediococcus claussenii TaxID=187452 RepID=UPI00081A8051|nr:chromosome segregation protein SMC [Pediococcus claussenii]ANZ70349.1 chromosome segregation protein SMC [Pediococcus claussenii]ANZ72165.1 chromosome segregation protein SMC [Pediococcus claussenii]
MNKIDEIEEKRSKLDRKLRQLKRDKDRINIDIEEVTDELKKIEQEELSMFKGREIQTESWRYIRTESNPDKANWWTVTKDTEQSASKVAQVLADIDKSLISINPSVSGIKRMIVSGRLVVRDGGQILDIQTGSILPYRAEQKLDKLTVKAVES